jgi:hypothetical protein
MASDAFRATRFAQFGRIGSREFFDAHSERFTHEDGFNEVEAALAALVFAHVALRQPQMGSDFRLSQILGDARFLQEFAKDIVSLRVSGLRHAAMLCGLHYITQNRILSGRE